MPDRPVKSRSGWNAAAYRRLAQGAIPDAKADNSGAVQRRHDLEQFPEQAKRTVHYLTLGT